MMKKLGVLIVLLAVAGCVSNKEDEMPRVKDVILRYNHLLAEGYASFDMRGLSGLITPNQAARLDHRLMGLKMAKKRMDTRLENIEFLKVTFKNDKITKQRIATVRTRETWDIRYADLNNGRTVKKMDGAVYLILYSLQRKDEKWLIDNDTVMEEKSDRSMRPGDGD